MNPNTGELGRVASGEAPVEPGVRRFDSEADMKAAGFTVPVGEQDIPEFRGKILTHRRAGLQSRGLL